MDANGYRNQGDFEGPRRRLSPAWLRAAGVIMADSARALQAKASRSRNQAGQGMVEYALILVLVSIVVIVILITMGNQIANVFSNVVAALG